MYVTHAKPVYSQTSIVTLDKGHKMSNDLKNLIHGRETYIADFGPDFVMKRPLPKFSESTISLDKLSILFNSLLYPSFKYFIILVLFSITIFLIVCEFFFFESNFDFLL